MLFQLDSKPIVFHIVFHEIEFRAKPHWSEDGLEFILSQFAHMGATSDELHLEKIWLKFNRSYYFEWLDFLIDRSSSPFNP